MVKKIINQGEATATVEYYYDNSPYLAYRAFMKYDGCVEITKFYNGGTDEEQLHICHVNDFIEDLKAMEADRLALIKNAE
jgi:hypothetical protein